MSNGGAGLDIDDLDAGVASALKGADITPDMLAQLAGADHRISSNDELGRLFDLIDRVDHDGSFNSIATTKTDADGKTVATASGEVYDALASELARARLGAPATSTPIASAINKKDPTALPSPAECQKSLTAIQAQGFTDIHLRPLPYMNQSDGRWANTQYDRSPPVPGEVRTIKQAGCAPTSLAMADCCLRDSHMRPEDVAKFAVAAGVSGAPNGAGTNTAGLVHDWAKANGLSVTAGTSPDQSKNVDVLKAGLESNGVALISVGVNSDTGKGHFTTTSHVMVVNGCAMKDGEEWFAIANPGRRDQATPHAGLLSVDDDVKQIPGAANGDGSVWISRTQLEAEMERCFVLHAGAQS
ncbi:MAG TPA: C39 family peptidase [Polyangia bacterium]|nr:C39 family peptidase [Polyangia bacterium]